MAEAGYGATEMAFGGSEARYRNDSQLLVKFFNHPKMDKVATKQEGRPIFKEVPYIQILTAGNKESIIIRPATEMDKRRFPEHYKKFELRSEEQHVEGTRLEEWPMVTRAQVEELKFFNIHTVEQLAGMADSNAQGFMGINLLKQKAQQYLDTSKTVKASEDMRKAQEEIAELKAMVAKLSEGQDEDSPKRRGRPPKTEE